MMDSFPQFSRCAERQWAGLTDQERQQMGIAVHFGQSAGRQALQKCIWGVATEGGRIVEILSIKFDSLKPMA